MSRDRSCRRGAGLPGRLWPAMSRGRLGSTWPGGWSRATTRWWPGSWSTASGSWLSARGWSRPPTTSARRAAWPTHPELLDWLACEFVDSGWNVKAMLKPMVMSQTYRQSSTAQRGDAGSDPANRWLARQNRFRLDAELVRDNALAISGLLSDEDRRAERQALSAAGLLGFPQFPQARLSRRQGENQYRRGLYTYWQRTFLHPSLLAFDASTREECVVQRPRSNTPLQALVLAERPDLRRGRAGAGGPSDPRGGSRPRGSPGSSISPGPGAPAAARRRLAVLVRLVAGPRSINIRPTRRRPARCSGSAIRPPPPTSTRPSWRPGRPWPASCLNLHETITRS